jgi:hypothetical protein
MGVNHAMAKIVYTCIIPIELVNWDDTLYVSLFMHECMIGTMQIAKIIMDGCMNNGGDDDYDDLLQITNEMHTLVNIIGNDDEWMSSFKQWVMQSFHDDDGDIGIKWTHPSWKNTLDKYYIECGWQPMIDD